MKSQNKYLKVLKYNIEKVKIEGAQIWSIGVSTHLAEIYPKDFCHTKQS